MKIAVSPKARDRTKYMLLEASGVVHEPDPGIFQVTAQERTLLHDAGIDTARVTRKKGPGDG